MEHFNNDKTLIKMWWYLPNPVLNGMAPKDYPVNRLLKMIDDALSESKSDGSKDNSQT